MRNTLIFVLILLGLIILSSCDKDQTTPVHKLTYKTVVYWNSDTITPENSIAIDLVQVIPNQVSYPITKGDSVYLTSINQFDGINGVYHNMEVSIVIDDTIRLVDNCRCEKLEKIYRY